MASTPTYGAANGSANGALHNKLLDNVVRTPGRQPSPQPTHLSVPGAVPKVLHETGPGYVAPKFEGKEQQMQDVINQIDEKGFIPEELVESEVKWFYNELGIDDMYFSTESVEAIVSHVHSLYAAKIAAYARDDKKLDIRLDKEASDHAVYIDTSVPGVSHPKGSGFEARLESKYLDGSGKGTGYRVESFRSPSKLAGTDAETHQSLRCYFVYQTRV
jgi:glutamate dehydrogenase